MKLVRRIISRGRRMAVRDEVQATKFGQSALKLRRPNKEAHSLKRALGEAKRWKCPKTKLVAFCVV
jgi:hypothetical protein